MAITSVCYCTIGFTLITYVLEQVLVSKKVLGGLEDSKEDPTNKSTQRSSVNSSGPKKLPSISGIFLKRIT